MRAAITPLLIAYNEAPNIRRAIAKLQWADRIVVVDSGSTDWTTEWLPVSDKVALFDRPFTNFAEQWNFGLSKVQTAWALSLDADYELSDAFVEEIFSLTPDGDIAGYDCQFTYRIYGRALRGTLYPKRTVLFLKSRSTYVMDGHTQRLAIDGAVNMLNARIYHDDRKPLSRWIASQRRYAHDEADHLLSTGRGDLGRADKLRLMAWPAPIVVLIYVLLVKRCVLDGWPGWFYAFQRMIAECLLSLELIERRLSRDASD